MNAVRIFIKALLSILLVYAFLKYILIVLLLYGILEMLIYIISKFSLKPLKDFICNITICIFKFIDILLNIFLQIPANRILIITPDEHPFGKTKQSFTKVLFLNFVYNNLKPRGLWLYNIVTFFRKKLFSYDRV